MNFRRYLLAGALGLLGSLPAVAMSLVASPWSGNVTATSATIAVRLKTEGRQVRAVVSESPTLAAPLYSELALTTAATGNILRLDVAGLQPFTSYYYGIEVDGQIETDPATRGTLRTFPIAPNSFRIAFGSCGDFRNSDQSAFDAILAERPLVFLHTGDFHYSNTNTTDVGAYRANYDAVLNQPNEAALYRNVPVAYMWDDHDYCGNDTVRTAVGREAALQAYGEYVPHYPYGPADGTIGQAFTIGRVRVIMTDLRSAADPDDTPDTPAKTRLGTAQKAWFKAQLLAAQAANYPLILWVSTVPWIGTPEVDDDTWGGYADERAELATFIRDNHIRNLVVLCGDMHALAYDDGQHSDYATGGGAPLIMLAAASLTRNGSSKGGPYTAGPIPGSPQYGVLEITDIGGPFVQCKFRGMKVGDGAKMTYSFTTFAPQSTSLAGRSFVNVSTRGRIASKDDILIVGFVVSGEQPRNVLMRAVGPSLASFGISDPLPQPLIRVFSGQRKLAEGGSWGATNRAEIMASAARVGAFALTSPGSKDAALFMTLDPGVYTLQVSSGDGNTGTVLAEAYDVP